MGEFYYDKPNKIRISLDPTKLNKAIQCGAYPTRTIEEVVAGTVNAKFFSVLDAQSGYWQIELREFVHVQHAGGKI